MITSYKFHVQILVENLSLLDLDLPARLATLITRPCADLRKGRNALVTRTTPITLTASTRSNWTTEHHSISVKMAIPALFTTAHSTEETYMYMLLCTFKGTKAQIS